MRALLAALIILVLAASAASARELFVAPTGRDTNPGTMAQPFATLGQACAVVQAGDIISLRAGDYPRSTYWDTGSDGTPRPRGSPSAPTTAPAPRAPAPLTLHGKQYVHVIGLDIDGRGGGNAFHVDGHSQYVTLRDCYVHDAGRDGDCIKVNQSDYITLEGNEVARPGYRADGETFQEGDRLRGCGLQHHAQQLRARLRRHGPLHQGRLREHRHRRQRHLAPTQRTTPTPPPASASSAVRSASWTARITPPTTASTATISSATAPAAPSAPTTAYHAYFYNNLVHQLRAAARRRRATTTASSSSAPALPGEPVSRTPGRPRAPTSSTTSSSTRGARCLPSTSIRSGNYSDFRTGNNCYYNAGQPIPTAGLVDPNKETGAVFANPCLSNPDGDATTYHGWIDCYRLTAKSRALLDRGASAARQPRPGVTKDITGAKRPQGRGYDIGPFEWPGT